MSKNSIASILKVVAIIFVALGIIGSLVLGKLFAIVEADGLFDVEEKYNWGAVFAGIFCSALSGLLLYGFGEIISLLQDSVNAQENILKKLSESQEMQKPKDNSLINSISTVDNATKPVERTPGQKVVPLQTNLSSEIQCPVCGQKQRNTRTECFKCGAEFVTK